MKAKNEVILILTRNEETQEYPIDFKNMKDLLKAVPKLTKIMKQGWNLTEVQGKGSIANFFRQQIISEQEKGEKYKVPIRQAVKLGWESSPHKEKVSLGRVKRFLRRKT